MTRDDLLALGEMPQDVDRVLARRLADCLRVMDGESDELPTGGPLGLAVNQSDEE